ncbi:MAG: alpha/beta hydrolase [Bacteroidota bacterium]
MLTRSALFTLLLLVTLPILGQTNRSCQGFRYVIQIFASTTQTTVQYGEASQGGNTETLFMDVYQPQGDTFSSRAVMILAHGGDFTNGDRTDMADLARQFAEHGYVAATIDYRLLASAPADSIEMASAIIRSMHDLKAAVRYFRDDQKNARTYGIDTNFVFVGGYSAGALAALHAGYLSDSDAAPGYFETALAAEGGLEGQSNAITGASSRIQAVLNLAGGMVDRRWMQSSEAPLISYHGENDQVVPTNGGLAFGVINLDGSALIHQEADQKDVFNYY